MLDCKVLKNIRLTDKSSKNVVVHIEIEKPLDSFYEPGDSIAVYIEDDREPKEGAKRVRPRLYSIASSPSYHPQNEVHITVKLVQYYDDNYNYFEGICSSYLSGLKKGDLIKIDFKSHKRFRLPVDRSKPVIMIGPGVGYAPFRSFIYERHSQSAGENWLFYGMPHSETDYIYRDEIEDLLDDGTIKRLSLAFSRDIPEKKVYVQDRIREEAEVFFDWVFNKGAYIYICGDKNRMSKAVEAEIKALLLKYGSSETLFDDLKKGRRYLKSVY